MNRKKIYSIFQLLSITAICVFFIVSCTKSKSVEKIIYDSSKIYSNYKTRQLYDGPYISFEDNIVTEKVIVDGNLVANILDVNPNKFQFPSDDFIFNEIDKIAVISDLHGQFDLTLDILKNNRIIDDDLNWIFGKGHLVVLGDVLDRGKNVTELLWLIYNLEQQAELNGGKVHFLMGNHEFMVIQNDLRYVHEKYNEVLRLLNVEYDQLFNSNTFFGRWLRSKPTLIKINDILFVHAGISHEFIEEGFNINEINELLVGSMDRSKDEMKKSSFYKKYYGSTGPIWYRGYFEDDLSEKEISQLLEKLNVKQIIVGHTTQEQIMKFYNGKIFCVDSGIKNGEYGEILLIEDDSFIRGTISGDKINFK